MVDAASTGYRCSFEWDIYNPFLPGRILEATFCHESPTVTQWKVTLIPVDKSIENWGFLFSLERFDRRSVCVADSTQVLVNLNGKEIVKKEDTKHIFCSDNEFKYHFEGSAERHPQTKPHSLVVKIEITLPSRAKGIELGDGIFCYDGDLKRLSSDLSLHLTCPEYTNMTLWSSNREKSFKVHSYILDARWDNFFKENSVNENNRHNFETNISLTLLPEILTYMYSGTIPINWPHWETPAYISELFQVINQYKLYHYYQAFVKNDLKHVRMTRNPVIVESHLFPLHIVRDRPINDASYLWHVNIDSEFYLVFQIRVRDEAYNWLSYSLVSRSPSRVHVQVNIDIMSKLEGNEPEVFSRFHEQEFAVDPGETLESGPLLFLGCPETLGNCGKREIKYFIRSFLNVTNGQIVEQIQCEHSDRLRNTLERFAVLADHMHNLNKRRLHGDMRIRSLPGFVNGYRFEESIHKGVLAVRVPEWWGGFENVSKDGGIPDFAISTLSSDTIRVVLDFIYTGKLSSIPFPFLEEVRTFAGETLFWALYELITGIRSHRMYR